MSIPARLRMRLLLAIPAAFALLLSPIAAHAQAAAGYRIAGRVINSVTGAPVPYATVSALTEADNRVVATAVTDAAGNFSFAGLAAGKYPLTASRRGFRTEYYDEHEESFNTAIVTGPDQDTEHLAFKLAPEGVIYGTITGDGGDPVENAQVMLFRRDPATPDRRPLRVQGTTTDDIGAYEFSGLPAGAYFIAVGAQPWYAMHGGLETADAGVNSLDVAYPVTFFDSTTDEASASSIDVTAGERAEANISLHAVPALRIKLTGLQLHSGLPMPVSNLRQTVFGADFPAQVDMEGNGKSFEFVGLAPGHYKLDLTNPPRTMDLDASSSMEVDPSSGTPMQPVDGTVRMADGSPPGNVMLTLAQPDRPGVTAIARGGQFHFAAVPPGVWALSAASFPAVVHVEDVESVTSAGVPVPAGQIAVRDHPVTLAVILSRSQASIAGFASNHGKPAPGSMIVLVPRDPAAWPALARRDQSDSDGSFSLTDVPPGRYTVVAIDGWNLDWQDPAVIARYLPAGQAVTIGTETSGVIRLPQPVPTAAP